MPCARLRWTVLKARDETRIAIQGPAPLRNISPSMASRKRSSSVTGPMKTMQSSPKALCDMARDICSTMSGSSMLSVRGDTLTTPKVPPTMANKPIRQLMDETSSVVRRRMLCRKKRHASTARMFAAIIASEKAGTSIPTTRSRTEPNPCAKKKTSRVRRAGESVRQFIVSTQSCLFSPPSCGKPQVLRHA